MTTRSILAEYLSNPPLPTGSPKRGIYLSLAHNEIERAFQSLRLGFCSQYPPGPIQLSLIQPQVLVPQRRSSHNFFPFSVLMYIL